MFSKSDHRDFEPFLLLVGDSESKGLCGWSRNQKKGSKKVLNQSRRVPTCRDIIVADLVGLETFSVLELGMQSPKR